jgi:uncharacterized protein (TIGR03067 family)
MWDRRSLVIVFASLAVAGCSSRSNGPAPSQVSTVVAPATKGEWEKLQGTWVMVAFERDGKKVEPSSGTVIFDGDTMTWKDRFSSFAKTFRLDPDFEPKRIDTKTISDGTNGLPGYGVYELDGDTLKLCLDSNERPISFETKPGTDSVLWVLKRQER